MTKIKITTTFKQLHDNSACTDRYRHLAKSLGGITKYGRSTPINLLQILEHNGLDDFFWAMRTVEDNEVFRLMGADFAESVLSLFENPYPDDKRPREAIEAARQYARGEIDTAAWDAARDAARDAAWDAAWAAARAAARDAARDAARAAAWAAARDAAWAAAWDAAWAAEQKKQIIIIKKYLK